MNNSQRLSIHYMKNARRLHARGKSNESWYFLLCAVAAKEGDIEFSDKALSAIAMDIKE